MVLPDLAPYVAAGALVSASEAAALHGQWRRTRPDDYSYQVRGRLLQGIVIPANAYIAGTSTPPMSSPASPA